MKHRRPVIVWCAAAAMVITTSAAAQTERKLTDAQAKEVKLITKIVDDVAAGQPAPNDFGLAWVHNDVLRVTGGKELVPFTVSLDPAKASGPVTLDRRVVSKGPAPDPAAGAKKDKDKKAEFPYEDLTAGTPDAGGLISRSFMVGAGSYDVYIVAREPVPNPKKGQTPKVSVLKQAVDVPDLWNDELNLSSIIVTKRMDPLPVPLTPLQQSERPYALGTMELIPNFELKFKKDGELSVFFFIYNAKANDQNKPDVAIEYAFFSKQADGDKPFNKTSPQALNGQTLPPEYNAAVVRQLPSGQAVPLGKFPEGAYRLEIKVTDKIANKTLTRNLDFTVGS